MGKKTQTHNNFSTSDSVITTGGYSVYGVYGVFKNRIDLPVDGYRAVSLFRTQPSSDTTMRQLGRSKPASVGPCVA